jgi:lipoprotein-anchoring transpeptidase ErfK/SrfK
VKKRTYTDKNITAGKDYVYKIRGIRVYNKKKYTGLEKLLSSATGIKNMGKINTYSFLSKALLAWSPVEGATGYEVYVKRNSGKWDKVDDVVNCAYLSNKVSGKVYKFAVKPYKRIGNDKLYGKLAAAKVKIKTGTLYGNSPRGTWVEVSTSTQMMFMYVNNKLYVSTPVVTGNIGDRATTKGVHHVISKKSPARLHGSYGGSSWDTTVSYWLGFTSDGQGIHDASWRSAFGGNIYKGNGSHGCVNTPTAAIRKMFGKAYVGMPVIVY